MALTVGVVYKVKNIGTCVTFRDFSGVYIRITSIKSEGRFHYDILDFNGKKTANCWDCLCESDLELSEDEPYSGKLRYDEKIVFTVGGQVVIEYHVRDNYMTNIEGSNSAIFGLLKLDKKAFCTKHYGYEAGNDSWPEFHRGDFDALQRVVDALKELTGEEVKKSIEEEPIKKSDNKKSFMSKIITAIKNAALTADEKMLRKHGFKNDCGEYTMDAREMAVLELCKEKEAKMIEVAQAMENEEKSSK